MSDFATHWTVALQAPVHGIFQARILEWVAFSLSKDLSARGIEPTFPVSPHWQADSLPAEPSF